MQAIVIRLILNKILWNNVSLRISLLAIILSPKELLTQVYDRQLIQ